MKKLVTYLLMVLAFNMLGSTNTYALDFGGNMDIGTRGLLLLIGLHIIFLFIGTKIAGITHRTLGQVIWATLGIIAIFFFMLVFTQGGNFEGLGLLVVGILSIILIQRLFNTTLLKALEASVFALIANGVALFVIIPKII
jgi:hypothetical protein